MREKKIWAEWVEHNVIDFLPGFISFFGGIKMEPKSLWNCNETFNFVIHKLGNPLKNSWDVKNFL